MPPDSTSPPPGLSGSAFGAQAEPPGHAARADAAQIAQWIAAQEPSRLFATAERFDFAKRERLDAPELLPLLSRDDNGADRALSPARDLFLSQAAGWTEQRWEAAAQKLADASRSEAFGVLDAELERLGMRAARRLALRDAEPFLLPWIIRNKVPERGPESPLHWKQGALFEPDFACALDETPLPPFLSHLTAAARRENLMNSLAAQLRLAFPDFEVSTRSNLVARRRRANGTETWAMAVDVAHREAWTEVVPAAQLSRIFDFFEDLLRASFGDRAVFSLAMATNADQYGRSPSGATAESMAEIDAQAERRHLLDSMASAQERHPASAAPRKSPRL